MKNLLRVSLILMIGVLAFSACQSQSLGPEKPLASQDNERVVQRTIKKASTIVPTLTQTIGAESSEYRLESQTARYLNSNKSEIEIDLADNVSITCEDQEALPAGKNIIKIKLKSKDGSALQVQDFSGSSGAEYSAVLVTSDGEENLNSVDKINVSAINDSIIRGQISLANENIKLEGEFFAAICR